MAMIAARVPDDTAEERSDVILEKREEAVLPLVVDTDTLMVYATSTESVARSWRRREVTSVATTLMMSSLVTSSSVEATDVLKAAVWAVPKPEADTPVRRNSEAICTSSEVAMVGTGVVEEVGSDVGCAVVGSGVG